jgi:hypothetical protein
VAGRMRAPALRLPGRAIPERPHGLRRAALGCLTMPQTDSSVMWTALSRGTERLVFEGRVPDAVAGRMRAPAQGGELLAASTARRGGRSGGSGQSVARGATNPSWCGWSAKTTLCPLPPDLPPRRAVLAANMETALNAAWDSGAG